MISDLFEEFEEVMSELKEARKNAEASANTNTPCQKCLGYYAGCTMMCERNPNKECQVFAEKGKTKIEYSDGTNIIM